MAPTATPRVAQQPACPLTLFLAFEFGVHQWKLCFTTGAVHRPRERQVPAGDGQRVCEEIQQATQRCGLPEEVRVVSCYEAGRDGCWLHRFLATHDGENCVADSASSEVNRRHRRAKTDRLDVHKRLTMLWRHVAGERKAVVLVTLRVGERGHIWYLSVYQQMDHAKFVAKLSMPWVWKDGQ